MNKITKKLLLTTCALGVIFWVSFIIVIVFSYLLKYDNRNIKVVVVSLIWFPIGVWIYFIGVWMYLIWSGE